MSVIHQEKRTPIDLRAIIVPLALAVAMVVLFLRLWYLQVVMAGELTERAANTRSTIVHPMAPRGAIVDRNGVVLAGTKSTIVVTGQPRALKKDPQALAEICAALDMDPADALDKLDNAYRPIVPTPLKIGVGIELATRIAESTGAIPGVSVSSLPLRYYSDSKSYAHILGYVWTASKSDIDRLSLKGLKPADYVGKIGLERIYESDLMGVPGTEELEVDAKQKPIRFAARDNPVPGSKITLGLDADLQRYAITKLSGHRGGIVGLDPTTGEVLCMVSSPTYDAAQFSTGISKAEYQALLNDPAKPLINRAIGSSYAPGSTFKIVTSIASHLAGKFNPNRAIFCPGYYSLGKRKFKCLGHHGAITFRNAFAKSCNAYFATLGVEAGVDRLREACELVGLGNRTGIDLVGESPGLVPTDRWIRKWRKDGAWYLGDTVNLSVGQGELSCTPIQMASVVSLVANNGKSFVPHLARAITPFGQEKPNRIEPKPLGHVDADAVFWSELRAAMIQVVTAGTARAAQIPGIDVAGKTGSAENRRNAETHSWFVCYAPADKPQIALAVVVENAGHGGEVAAPIAGDILRHFFAKKQSSSSPVP